MDNTEGTIISGGISKWCGAAGWRLGTFVFPKELHWLLDSMSTAASETYTSTSAPIQYASIAAYTPSPEIEEYLRHSRRVLGVCGNGLLSGCVLPLFTVRSRPVVSTSFPI